MLQDLQNWQVEGTYSPWRTPGRIGLSVVVPCYNEAPVIDALMARLEPICEAVRPGDYEIVLVNDGSSDATWSLIEAHAARSPHIVGVDLARNHGHQLALTCGLQVCRGDLVMAIDADLQDPPELLPEMIRLIEAGADVVYGQRVARAGETLFKKASAAAFYRLLEKLIDIRIPRDTGDFRLMTRPVVDALNAMPERFRFVRGMVGWVGFRQVALPYRRDARFAGETHYPLRKMLALAFDAVTSFSVKPLRLASLCGGLSGLAGFVMLGWVLSVWLRSGTVHGWTSMIGVVLILGSLQLLVLGVFGEYLGRMYIETKGRPMYIVREVRRGDPQ
ncbi:MULTISPECIES: glycosyltransferase family 2 protein [Novosphingobium]|uniref:glycosyltransferase family 2 protein n=1 Tax=Novosphingobium TaxID=165696 RepID=UPI001CD7C8F3|nr:glycosyltransferase family 2 protein [Novosphingobium percolationis]MCH7629819.1 glycosyltransferase family 2 protein [Pseudomonadota bacterium]